LPNDNDVPTTLRGAEYTVTLDTYGDWIEDDKTTPAPLPSLPRSGARATMEPAEKPSSVVN
jgi:hypothetical protein